MDSMKAPGSSVTMSEAFMDTSPRRDCARAPARPCSSAPVSYTHLGGDVALIIGNEARGVSEGVRALATHRLKLPMPGRAESLNAAVAAGIMIYACISGRR